MLFWIYGELFVKKNLYNCISISSDWVIHVAFYQEYGNARSPDNLQTVN